MISVSDILHIVRKAAFHRSESFAVCIPRRHEQLLFFLMIHCLMISVDLGPRVGAKVERIAYET